jgi:Mce-associated membrane protein
MTERAGQTVGWWRQLLRPGRFAVLLVVLLLAAAAGYLGVRAYTLSARAATLAARRDAALSAASAYAVDLTTYDYRHLDDAFARVAADATPGYAEQYRSASQQRAGQLRTDRSVSTGRVVAAGLQQGAGDDSAGVLVLVDQSITNTGTPAPQVQRSDLRLTLTWSGDRWLLAGLVLL